MSKGNNMILIQSHNMDTVRKGALKTACSLTVMFQLQEDLVPQPPYWGSALGQCWELLSPGPLFYSHCVQ